jgi:phosphoribosylformylglycinamidine synthase
MKPFEILLSESQERMLVVVHKGKEKIVKDIFDKWDLQCEEIGEVTEGGRIEFYLKGEKVADVPAEELVLGGGAPQYEREYKEPAYFKENQKFDINTVPEPENLKEMAFKLLAQPNIASKKWVMEQYDSMVGTANMTTNAPADAGIVNIKGSNKALAFTVDCNARYVYADPEIGTEIAVAEAARNLVCSGAEPSAITNCLNFGNPYNPEVYWQFVGAIKGMSTACKKFNTPVTGGNVSFYNQTEIKGEAIPVFPTPTIGMMGILNDKSKSMSLNFKNKGDMIYLLGTSKEDINSSEYLANILGIKNSPAPYFDIEKEIQLHRAIMGSIKFGLINSAHDVSDGGLFVTMIEKGIPNNLGFDIMTDSEIRPDAYLFGDGQGRVVVSVNPGLADDFIDFITQGPVQVIALGHVTQGKIVIDDEHWGFIADAKKIYNESLENNLS